jgi:hypothetical protein
MMACISDMISLSGFSGAAALQQPHAKKSGITANI